MCVCVRVRSSVQVGEATKIIWNTFLLVDVRPLPYPTRNCNSYSLNYPVLERLGRVGVVVGDAESYREKMTSLIKTCVHSSKKVPVPMDFWQLAKLKNTYFENQIPMFSTMQNGVVGRVKGMYKATERRQQYRKWSREIGSIRYKCPLYDHGLLTMWKSLKIHILRVPMCCSQARKTACCEGW
jgi:hypothetical protein